MIEGRIQTRSWDGKDGIKQYRTEIVAERIQFGPRNAAKQEGFVKTKLRKQQTKINRFTKDCRK